YRSAATNSKSPEPSPPKSLSTKVLADVVASLIGVAYLTSGYSGAIEVCSRFNLSSSLFPWHPLEMRIDSLLSIATENDQRYRRYYPNYFQDLQQIIGYTFSNCALLLEAITHISFGGDSTATSY